MLLFFVVFCSGSAAGNCALAGLEMMVDMSWLRGCMCCLGL